MPGVWYGSIGDYPIMLCVESDKVAYYYRGKSADIELHQKDGTWIEPGGQWAISTHGEGIQAQHHVEGKWSKAGSKQALGFELGYLVDIPAACSSATYRQTLLLPGDRLSLPLPQVGQVAAGGPNAAVIKPNGELWIWGEKQPQPKLVGKDYVRVAVGLNHTVAIKTDGSLWGWGRNQQGQLGSEAVRGNHAVHMGDGFVAVAVNHEYTLAVRNDGTLWSWGGAPPPGKFDEATQTDAKPRLIGKSFVSVSAGDTSFSALKSDGTLWAWGMNDGGQLGIRDTGSWVGREYKHEELPMLVGGNYMAVATGYANVAAVRTDGTLWTWGSTSWGELGNGSDKASSSVPLSIGDGYTQVAAGMTDVAAIKSDSSLWLWGGNELGMFGDCTTKTHNKPVQVGSGFVQVAVGAQFLVAMKADGSVWTWGWPWDGDQMDTPRKCRKPKQVEFGDGVSAWQKRAGESLRPNALSLRGTGDIVSIAASTSHSAMVKADGSLWTWGSNEYGQLATGDTQYENAPRHIDGAYAEVFANDHYTLALKKDGSLWRWGAIPAMYPHGDFMKSKAKALVPVQVFAGTVRLLRSGYEMGRALGLRNDGTILDWPYYWDPGKKPVEFGSDVAEISAGQYGSFALRKDGSLWALQQYPVEPPPKQIGNAFVHVVSGADHAYGIKADGTLWAWGDNRLYQLGDGTQTSHADPVKIGSGFVDVATGRFHGIALAADGTVWAWGDNDSGAIGDGTRVGRTRPVKVGSGFVKIAAGSYHNLALKADGTLWAWGNNEDGQLGDSSTVRRLAPVQVYPVVSGHRGDAHVVEAPSAIVAVRTGQHHSCAFYRNGNAKCWGSNSEGQLGIENRVAANPRPLAVMYKERVLSQLDSDDTSKHKLDCEAGQAKSCDKIEAKHPFLRGARFIVDETDHFCALMSNGKIRCEHSGDDSFLKSDIDGLDDVVQFDLGTDHGCALLADGRVKCWGDNSHGQLGNGSLAMKYLSTSQGTTQVVDL
ncbi:MAG: hypothetical protein WBW32_14815 [Luteibacter sp.]